ncbi:unnamed protein product [Rotaria socialis]|uniref:Metallo-beta-lactamase domain-containing protein n=1 Tax=Rotaria socialis TaxID=392032 RepID=A0A821FU50_9BILA|nr:unnamed protein product [Rotaria socialis]CAF4656774.1 unnamed protein product [Rotaria socialis]
MIIISIAFLLLTISINSVSAITIDSIRITQVQDELAPHENSNAYIVISENSLEGFFVDTGSTINMTSRMISLYQQQIQSTSKPPQFVFLTHGHPDHMAGIVRIQEVYPSTPIYVISQQIIREAVKWVNFSCSINSYSAAQCAINYASVLRALSSPRLQLTFNHPSVKLDALSVVIKGETSYAGLLGLTTSSGVHFLFTGDAMTIRSHLYVSNFFETEVLPASDDALCAWAGSMQASVCDLQLGNRRSTILPGHGPTSDVSSYANDVAQNVEWLRVLRNLTFNSCNSTYIWNEMIRRYPDFGEVLLQVKGGLNTHVPADANSVNCNCTNGSPTICSVYNAPPTCIHLDFNGSDTTLACSMLSSTSSFVSQSLLIQPVTLLTTTIFILRICHD